MTNQKKTTDLEPIYDFLRCRTPAAWLEKALQQQDIMLLDHAANEMKAAQSAMTLIARNPTRLDLINKMSRLAREELLHYEQVLKILKKRGITHRILKAGSYASNMAVLIRRPQMENLVDTLIMGAIIEARSCERFAALVPLLDDELASFYRSLLKSEARHYQDYLGLASDVSKEDIGARVAVFLDAEADYITSPDRRFRFHSGVPVVSDNQSINSQSPLNTSSL